MPSLHQLEMRRDPGFPDVPVDTDVLGLLTGHVHAVKLWAEILKKHAAANKHRIDRDLANALVELGERVLAEVEDVTCFDCDNVAVQRGFDIRQCDGCQEKAGLR